MSGTVLHLVPIANLHDDGVQVKDWLELFERAFLPGRDFFEHLVGDLRDRAVGQLGADGGYQVVSDIPDGHAACVEGNDHLAQAAGAA